MQLTRLEQHMLRQCENTAITKRRMIWVVAFGLALGIGLIVFTVGDAPVAIVGWIAVAYVVITVLEKVSYGFGVLGYKSVIRKLVKRIEALEQET